MRIFIVAGPNGAGKTTFARFFLKGQEAIGHYLNADLIAAGLAPLKPEAAALDAGKIMLRQMGQLAALKSDFAFETTLSALNYLARIKKWQEMGYHVHLVFLRVKNPEFSVSRVRQRVKQGGHNIPEDVIRRRFKRGLENIEKYKKVVNSWQFYDNSAVEAVLLEEGKNEI
jgi:predicted ABC-type ATPase